MVVVVVRLWLGSKRSYDPSYVKSFAHAEVVERMQISSLVTRAPPVVNCTPSCASCITMTEKNAVPSPRDVAACQEVADDEYSFLMLEPLKNGIKVEFLRKDTYAYVWCVNSDMKANVPQLTDGRTK